MIPSSNSNYSVPFQYLEIKRKFGDAIIFSSLHKASLNVELEVQPTPFSKRYVLTIYFKKGKLPQVWLKNTPNNGDVNMFPHIYRADSEKNRIKLCLFHPRKYQWDPRMLLSDTVMIWAIEWLLFYEIWLSTGIWTGGGEHPS